LKKAFICIFLLLLISLNITASADEFAPPPPSNFELEDGKLIFYFTPLRFEDDYPPTGLYYNNDPPEVIYLVNQNHIKNSDFYRDFGIYPGFISSDGMYFVRVPIPLSADSRLAQPDEIEIALEFYEEGEVIKRYYISDLVKDESKLGYTTSMVLWTDMYAEKVEDVFNHNLQNNTLAVTTIENITYTFDITTGEIINVDKGNKNVFVIVVGSVPLICIIMLIILIRKKKQWKKKDFKN